jgi:hypothetical protein
MPSSQSHKKGKIFKKNGHKKHRECTTKERERERERFDTALLFKAYSP